MTVFPSDPIETFSLFFSELVSAGTALKQKKKKNQTLKEQVDALSKELLKETGKRLERDVYHRGSCYLWPDNRNINCLDRTSKL